jgi:Ca-activated chloride channel family protein
VIQFFNDITFSNKEAFYLFFALPVFIAWYIYKNKNREAEFNYSSLILLGKIKSSGRAKFRHILFVFRLITFSAIILIIARPQSRSSWKDIKTEGIDIVLCMDVSHSMLAKDFDPNRLESSKEVAIQFIDSRPTDRIGLVVFSGEAFTQCPLTTDHAILKNIISEVKTGQMADGTAIGLGLADAVSRVKESNAKSKVVILLSDGVSNIGEIAPLTAGEIAKTFGVKVYSVGVGSKGKAYTPVYIYPNGHIEFDYVDVEIDEVVMNKISEMTGGKYFRATDNKSLKKVYEEIDRMEKSVISERNYSNKAERFFVFALIASISLLLEFILKNTLFKSVP